MTPIYHLDGTIQCIWKEPISLKAHEKQLRTLGVSPANGRQDVRRGYQHALCGAPTGGCNVFDIPEDEAIKFQKVLQQNGWELWDSGESPAVAELWSDATIQGDDNPYPLARELSAALLRGDEDPYPLARKLAALLVARGDDTPFPLAQPLAIALLRGDEDPFPLARLFAAAILDEREDQVRQAYTPAVGILPDRSSPLPPNGPIGVDISALYGKRLSVMLEGDMGDTQHIPDRVRVILHRQTKRVMDIRFG